MPAQIPQDSISSSLTWPKLHLAANKVEFKRFHTQCKKVGGTINIEKGGWTLFRHIALLDLSGKTDDSVRFCVEF